MLGRTGALASINSAVAPPGNPRVAPPSSPSPLCFPSLSPPRGHGHPVELVAADEPELANDAQQQESHRRVVFFFLDIKAKPEPRGIFGSVSFLVDEHLPERRCQEPLLTGRPRASPS